MSQFLFACGDEIHFPSCSGKSGATTAVRYLHEVLPEKFPSADLGFFTKNIYLANCKAALAISRFL